MAKDKQQQPKPSDVLSMPARPMRSAQETFADRPIAEKLASGPPESLPEIPTLSPSDSADSSELLPVTIPMAYAEPSQFIGPVTIKVTLYGTDARTFQRVFEGLNRAHAKLKNGNHIDKHPDVIRHLIENLAEVR